MLLSCGNPTSGDGPETGTVIDIEGNIYQTIKIGNQWWTVENLRTTKYNDSTPIPNVTDDNEWENYTLGAYCYYDNDSAANAVKYGALYNWHAINTGKLSPEGWHVPTSLEYDTLKNYLIANGYNWDGTTLVNRIGKSMAAKSDWVHAISKGHIGNDLSSNNSSGFSALPAGGRNGNGGSFSRKGLITYFWSASAEDVSNARRELMWYESASVERGYFVKDSGYSVRLVRD